MANQIEGSIGAKLFLSGRTAFELKDGIKTIDTVQCKKRSVMQGFGAQKKDDSPKTV